MSLGLEATLESLLFLANLRADKGFVRHHSTSPA